MFHAANKRAFSLIELMVTVTIIGVISAIGVAAYREYVVRSKLAEAYQNIGALRIKESTYYQEFNEFYSLELNPATIGNSMVIASIATWVGFDNPIPQGTNVYFAYRGWAGKTDNSGADIATSSATGNAFKASSVDGLIGGTTAHGTDCNTSAATIDSLGVTLGNDHAWIAIAAIGDLDNINANGKCTAFVQVVEASPGTANKPQASGLLSFNVGN